MGKMNKIYSLASQFISQGIAIFPVRFRDKKPAVPSWEIYRDALPTDKQLREWFPSDMRNWGIVLGWQRLAVLDFDSMDLFYDWQMWALKNCKLLDNAYSVKTSRGVHVYFSLLEETTNKRIPGKEEIANREAGIIKKLPAIDLKTSGYTIGPHSTHPGGFVYRAISENINFPIVERLSDILPEEILAHANDRSDYDAQPVNTDHIRAPQGERDLFDEVDNGPQVSPLERAKNRYKLQDFFPGQKVDRRGFIHVVCPFHADKEPSAWINTKDQLFGCYSCNMRPMSVVGFYAALHKIDIKSAIREMSK